MPVSVHSAGRCGNPYRVTTAAHRYIPPGTSASAAALPRDAEATSGRRPEHLPRVLAFPCILIVSGTPLAPSAAPAFCSTDERMMLIARLRLAAMIGSALLLTGCGGSGDSVDPAAALTDSIAAVDTALLAGLPPGTTMETLALGRSGFVVCTVCHGLDAEGTALGPSLTDSTWIHVPADIDSIAGLIRTGVSRPTEFPIPMPAMGGGDFDEEQLRAVATYVYALSRKQT